jgi:CheY-like chemotaxis protein
LIPSLAGDQRFTLRSRSKGGSPPAREAVSIVLAEDNPGDVRLVREALEEHGVEGQLILFKDGAKAIRFIQDVDQGLAEAPDLAVIDLNLPKRTGRDVLECLRASNKCSNVPVVILSSSDAAEDRAECQRLGVSRYIRKPSHLDEFLGIGAVLREMLGLPPA